MENILLQSKNILERSLQDFKPYAVTLLLSGGKDSLAALQVCLSLEIKIDFIIHINTRTGIKQTTDFVREYSTKLGIPYLEGDAGTKYEERVLSKGFFGRGFLAHSYSYHILKKSTLDNLLSREIRQRKRGRKILLINGARSEESLARSKKLPTPIRQDRSNIWVNAVHHWQEDDCLDFCRDNKTPINPVAQQLCRSAECMCGTMQSQAAREEAAFFYPEWGRWLDDLEKEVLKTHPWKWGQNVSRQWQLEQQGQLNLFDQPMCKSCLSTRNSL